MEKVKLHSAILPESVGGMLFIHYSSDYSSLTADECFYLHHISHYNFINSAGLNNFNHRIYVAQTSFNKYNLLSN